MLITDIRKLDWTLKNTRLPAAGTLVAVLASALALALFAYVADRPVVILFLPAAALLVWVSRKYGTLAIIVLIVAFPEFRVPGIPFDVPLLMPLIMVLFALDIARSGQYNSGGAGLAFGLFVAAMAFSWLWGETLGFNGVINLDQAQSSNIHLSRYRVVWQIGAWILGFGFFLYTVRQIRHIALYYRLINYLILAGVIVAAFGYYELLARQFSLPYFYPSNISYSFRPLAELDFGGLDLPRIYGTFEEPKLLGRFLLIPLFFSASVWIQLNSKRYLFYSVFILGVLMLTFSTTAWLGALAGFAVWMYFLQRKSRFKVMRYVGGTVFLLAAAWFFAGLFIPGLISSGLSFLLLHPARVVGLVNNPLLTSVDYVEGWRLGWTLFTSSPLFGVGIGYSPLLSGVTERVFTPFSLPLLILAETGIVGLVAFLTMIGTILYRSVRVIRTPANLANRPLAVVLMASALAAFAAGFITYLAFGGARFYMEDWVLLALMARGSQLMSKAPNMEETA